MNELPKEPKERRERVMHIYSLHKQTGTFLFFQHHFFFIDVYVLTTVHTRNGK